MNLELGKRNQELEIRIGNYEYDLREKFPDRI